MGVFSCCFLFFSFHFIQFHVFSCVAPPGQSSDGLECVSVFCFVLYTLDTTALAPWPRIRKLSLVLLSFCYSHL